MLHILIYIWTIAYPNTYCEKIYDIELLYCKNYEEKVK